MGRILSLILCILVLIWMPVQASAKETAQRASKSSSSTMPPPQLKGSGFPVPRFVTLKGRQTFVRTGPGVIYPVEWVFVRKGMPVEITAEFDTWRRIRDWEGAEGWVHQSLISGQRSVVITGKVRPLRRKPEADAPVLAQLQAGVIGQLERCVSQWCQIDVEKAEGWIRRNEIWGVYKDEKVD